VSPNEVDEEPVRTGNIRLFRAGLGVLDKHPALIQTGFNTRDYGALRTDPVPKVRLLLRYNRLSARQVPK